MSYRFGGLPSYPEARYCYGQDEEDYPYPTPRGPKYVSYPRAPPPPPPGHPQLTTHSLSTAITNNRKTTIILQRLASLLAALLPLQTASGCAMTTPPDADPVAAAANEPWILQTLLSLGHDMDESPPALHALHRLCISAAKTAADDLAAVLGDLHLECASPKRLARFVDKWGAFPRGTFAGLEFGFGAADDDDDDADVAGTSPSPPPIGNADTFGGPPAQELSIAGCLEFMASFEWIWEERREQRVRGGEGSVALRRLLHDGRGRRLGLANRHRSSRDALFALRERCAANMAHVLALLGHVLGELEAELQRRARCEHVPMTCPRLEACEAEIGFARGVMAGLVVRVERDGEALGLGLAGGNRKCGRRWEQEEEVWLLRRWAHLSEGEGGWGWGLVMGADEIVERIRRGWWVDFDGQVTGGTAGWGFGS